MIDVQINSDYITLGQLLKYVDLVQSGGQAKYFILENEIYVNNERESRRGRKLFLNDKILIKNFDEYLITND